MSIDGTSGRDSLEGTSADDTLNGLGGDDIISGYDGDDSLSGGEDYDTILGGAGADTIDGGDQDDTIDGGDDDDEIFGNTGDDNIRGGSGNDSIIGGDDNDYVEGDEGDDTVTGDSGRDTILGGAGDDSLDGGTDQDILDGGDGEDTLIGGTGSDILIGGADDDELSGDEGQDTLSGGLGNDFVQGGDDADMISGGAGDDTLEGEADNDIIFGGEGADSILGGLGADTIEAGLGDDTVRAGFGDDLVFSGGGTQKLFGGDDFDTLDYRGGPLEGNLVIDFDPDTTGLDLTPEELLALQARVTGTNTYGQATDDLIFEFERIFIGRSQGQIFDYDGTTFVETTDVSLYSDAETYPGTPGPDVIDPGPGNDEVQGSDGNDSVNASPGVDTVDGGNGNDTLDYGYYDLLPEYVLGLRPFTDADGFTPQELAKLQLQIDTLTTTNIVVREWVTRFEHVNFTGETEYFLVQTEADDLVNIGGVTIDLGSFFSSSDGDTLDFDTNSHFGDVGVFFRDGYVDLADPSLTQSYLDTNADGILQPLNVSVLIDEEDQTRPFFGFRFINVDNVSLTDADDRFALTPETPGSHSGTGTIQGNGGNDVIFITDIPSGELVVNGGDGNDIIIVAGGEAVTTEGGPGRDLIINTTPGGNLYGESETAIVIGADGKPSFAPETPENGDHFWFAPDTTIHDPQKYDILSFYGVPLTGGDTDANSIAWALGPGFADILTAVSSLTAFHAVLTGKNGGTAPGYVSFDTFLPNMIYKISDGSGEADLFVMNMTDILFQIATGQTTPEEIPIGGGVSASFKGVQSINNFSGATSDIFPTTSKGLVADVIATSLGGFASLEDSLADNTNDLGMLFNFPNWYTLLMAAANSIAGDILELTPAVGNLFKALGYLALADGAAWIGGAAVRLAKGLQWAEGEDPLVIDLDGDGIETLALYDREIFFDLDNDLFAEATGWVKSDDGFLVMDRNNNDRIDDISEMFGAQFDGGFNHLGTYDTAENGGNADGRITAADAIWAELQVWRDLNSDGITDTGELFSLDALGIVSIDLDSDPLGGLNPQGTELLSSAEIGFADGSFSRVYEAIFESNDTYTRYAGESGRAAWQNDLQVESKGYGSTTDLSVAIANDPELGAIVAAAANGMTEPDLLSMRTQVGPVLEYWGFTDETSRELTPVLLDTDSEGVVSLIDRAVYVEDETGGFWTLHSGNAITESGGAVIDRPTLEDVLAQATASGQNWQLEQTWSPAMRDEALSFRDEAPYLASIVDGRAVILDYGIQNEDGSWRLASGREIVDDGGQVIAAPTVEDVMALSREAGQEWRVEEISFNPYAAIDVEHIGVRFTDGIPIDYTIEVTDQDGTFLVWARNLDRALELQFKTGDSREFNLRNFAVDLDTLDEVNSSVDSTYRVELMTPGQFQYSTSLVGVDFREEMLTATLDNATGLIDYKTVPGGSYTFSEDEYQSVIEPMIDLVGISMQQYIVVSMRLAIRTALQGGLSDFARELEYDLDYDAYRATSDRGLAPMFEAIFEGAPGSNADDAVYDYLREWSLVLGQMYPDYKPVDPKLVFDTTVELDQTSLFQYMLAAYENVPLDLDILAMANALSVDETRVILHDAADTDIVGKDGVNFFYISEGDQNIVGSYAADAEVFDDSEQTDIYFIGANSGDDIILDRDLGDNDQLRFTSLRSDEVRAVRDGEDLILFYNNDANFVRLTDQFLGERNILLQDGSRVQSGVDQIIFADSQVWNRYRMSFEVVDFDRAAENEADAYFGSGSGDILFGGLGNDFMSGGAGGDTYIIEAGHGQDVIDDLGSFSFGPVQAGLDFLMFRGDITEDSVRLTRDGASEDLLISLLDTAGNLTGDTVELVGQFGGVRLNLGAFSEAIGADDGLDFVAPNLIEKIIFEKGGVLDYVEIVDRVLENAKTDGDDAIYGMLNNNTLDGGLGNDFLSGVEGFDTYIFGQGYGRDVILDSDFSSSLFGPKDDLLKFVDDLRWTDFDFLRDGAGDTLTMRITGTEDEVTMTDYLQEILLVGYINLIEDVEFGDGTVWNYLKLLQHYVDIAKTDGDDLIYGFETISDRLDGGLGNDRLEGQSANDTYVFANGYGVDTVFDTSGTDTVEFTGLNTSDIEFSRTALDLIITISGTGDQIILENQYVRADAQGFAVEYFQLGDQTLEFTDFNPEDIDLVGTSAGELIEGSNFAETIDGRGGDDTLVGRDGGDTYLFDVGYGEDVIVDVRERAAWTDRKGIIVPEDDIVKFGGDISQANIIFTKDADDLVISVADRTDTLRIRNQFLDLDNGVERFEFSDGSFLLISDVEELLQIEGGNRGDNLIEGNLTSPNTLDGRQGDDTLIGGSEADTYAFGADYDFDQIQETADVAGVIDRVQFGSSVTEDALRISRDGDNLIVDLGNGSDVLTIINGLTTTRIEEFRFGDGSILTLEEIIDRMLTGTDADEELIGLDNRNDTLTSGAGSDAMDGGAGDDTYKFGYGDDSDTITDSAGIDRLEFGTSIEPSGVIYENIDGNLLIRLAANGERIAVLNGYDNDIVDDLPFRRVRTDHSGRPNNRQIVDVQWQPGHSGYAPV